MLRDVLPGSYYSVLQPIRRYFLQNAAYKKQHHYLERDELGYRDLKHKEMFFIRNKQLPKELSVCAALIENLHVLSLECLRAISAELQLNDKNLLSVVDNEAVPETTCSSSILRVIYYRAGMVNASACDIHQDLGLLTLLCPTNIPALEIYDHVADKGWMDIELAQGADDVIVMAGESLSLISNGYYLPATHRVRVPEEPRLSIFYQLRFKQDAIIDSQQFETAVTGKFAKPFCFTGAEFLHKEIKVRRSVNGSY